MPDRRSDRVSWFNTEYIDSSDKEVNVQEAKSCLEEVRKTTYPPCAPQEWEESQLCIRKFPNQLFETLKTP